MDDAGALQNKNTIEFEVSLVVASPAPPLKPKAREAFGRWAQVNGEHEDVGSVWMVVFWHPTASPLPLMLRALRAFGAWA